MSSPERRHPRPTDGDRPLDPAADAPPAPPADDAPPPPAAADALPPAPAKDDDPDALVWNADDEAHANRWDANDPRRKHDCFAPPAEPCECHCLHCGRTFSSEGIWFQKVVNDPQGFNGFWMCPTPNCSGAGFTFDIFPTDPAHPANEGWHYDDEDEEAEAFDADDDDDEGTDEVGSVREDEDGIPRFVARDGRDADASDEDEYDPAETKYKDLDEIYGPDDDDDLEGEEWKYGLQPGERPPNPLAEEAEREYRREQEMYDEPDQRPRTLDWSDRKDRRDGPRFPPPYDGPDDQQFKDDDIPF